MIFRWKCSRETNFMTIEIYLINIIYGSKKQAKV